MPTRKLIDDTPVSTSRTRFRAIIKSFLHADRTDFFSKLFLIAHRKYRLLSNRRRFSGKTSHEIFTEIYKNGHWGKDSNSDEFYSGSGSHDAHITGPYIAALSKFLLEMNKPDIVDIGCGDFAVGSQLRSYFGNYVAADIVEPLIARNRIKYADLDVDFRVIDIAQDDIPRAKVLVVRQVLQHMSNTDIKRFIANSFQTCQYMIVTEHLPYAEYFPHNLEKEIGPDIRLYVNTPSGIVLTSSPFNLNVIDSKIICEVTTNDGICPSVIRTIVYKMIDTYP